MTEMLEQAFAEASKLPEGDQNVLADWLLRELQSERSWSKLFGESQDMLERLAAEALAEHHEGKTEDLDPRMEIQTTNVTRAASQAPQTSRLA